MMARSSKFRVTVSSLSLIFYQKPPTDTPTLPPLAAFSVPKSASPKFADTSSKCGFNMKNFLNPFYSCIMHVYE